MQGRRTVGELSPPTNFRWGPTGMFLLTVNEAEKRGLPEVPEQQGQSQVCQERGLLEEHWTLGHCKAGLTPTVS